MNIKDRFINALLDKTARNKIRSRSIKLADGLHVFLIGTGSPMPDRDRAGPCIAVVAGEKIYVVDAGDAAAKNIALVGLSVGKINALFLTHFHSDHIGGLGEIMLQRWVGGSNDRPLDVFGPTGVETVVSGFNRAYQLDAGYRIAHHDAKTVPPSGTGGVARTFTLSAEEDACAVVVDGCGVKVTAFKVNHQPVTPAVGYKFEYKGRSLVISGDTIYSPSLAKQSEGVDLLLHEALNQKLVGLMHKYSSLGNSVSMARITHDIPTYHSTPEDVAKIAHQAKVGQVVLYHLIPPLPSPILKSVFLGDARNIYDGPIIMGVDGMLVSLPADSKSIQTKYLFK